MQPYPGSPPSTPRWVKVFGTIAIILVLFVLFVLLTGIGGPHGPGRHKGSGDATGGSHWGLLILLGVLAFAGVALNWGRLVTIGTTVARHRRPHGVRLSRPQTIRRWQTKVMGPRLRTFALAAHVISSVGSLGAVAGFLALAVAGLTSHDPQLVRAAYLAMELTAWFVILPLITAALLTGLIQSLGTTWGLFRHYWVLVKFLLTVITIVVLLLQLEPISYVVDIAAETTLSGSDQRELRRSLLTHAAGGLLVLLAAATLSIYKPRGLTWYGWRKQHEERGLSQP